MCVKLLLLNECVALIYLWLSFLYKIVFMPIYFYTWFFFAYEYAKILVKLGFVRVSNVSQKGQCSPALIFVSFPQDGDWRTMKIYEIK